MRVTIKLFASFRNGRFKEEKKHLAEGTECRAVVQDLGLTEEEIGIVMINGRHAPLGRPLAGGDVLALFPLVGGG